MRSFKYQGHKDFLSLVLKLNKLVRLSLVRYIDPVAYPYSLNFHALLVI
jgi:hypothetical protein